MKPPEGLEDMLDLAKEGESSSVLQSSSKTEASGESGKSLVKDSLPSQSESAKHPKMSSESDAIQFLMEENMEKLYKAPGDSMKLGETSEDDEADDPMIMDM